MKLPFSPILFAAFLAAVILPPASGASAQSLGDGRLGVHPFASAELPAPSQSVEYSKMPRWVKWGLIGAVAGAITFGLFSRMSIEDDNPLLPDVALGVAVGFVTIGGAIAIYDLVCKPDSASERAGLC
jgi:hypothetical protein